LRQPSPGRTGSRAGASRVGTTTTTSSPLANEHVEGPDSMVIDGRENAST
jgi:hypothetical protein